MTRRQQFFSQETAASADYCFITTKTQKPVNYFLKGGKSWQKQWTPKRKQKSSPAKA
jgi:hypothetical protein